MNRREFLKRAGVTAAASLAIRSTSAFSAESVSSVRILYDPSDSAAASTPVRWAMQNLIETLQKKKIDARIAEKLSEVPPTAACVVAASAASKLAQDILKQHDLTPPKTDESFTLANASIDGHNLCIALGTAATGSLPLNPRGLVYALTELADSASYASPTENPLSFPTPLIERPANRIRSAMRMISSDIEDKSWFHDRAFWERYLTMLVTHRFNRINFSVGLAYDFPREIADAYFYFAYPFLLSVPGYNVRAPQLPDSERDKNLEMLRFASDEAAKRGLDFQLGIWTHAYEWPNSPGVNYTIDGITRDNHANYCRDAVRILLKECPNITGVTFRIHGESGVAEGSYAFWKAVFEGVATCGRKVGIDMHAKGMDQPMVDLALGTGLPITISPKYWAEHMGLPYHQAWIRPTEMPPKPRAGAQQRPGGQGAQGGGGFFSRSSGSRSFLRYGYGDLMAEDRKYDILFRMWPGTQRLLLWGDPQFAAAYGRASSFCGAAGMELMEPLSFKGRKGSGLKGPRDAYISGDSSGNHDFEDYLYSYRLWGRLAYNPDAKPETWQRQTKTDFGDAAIETENALASASRILPLIVTAHLPSAANNNYWPEIYTNMSIVDSRHPGSYTDTPSPKRFGTVSPLDPQLFSRIDDHADELLKGESVAKYSPAEVAHWLLALAQKAMFRSSRQPRGDDAGRLGRASTDIAIQAGIGRFFAHKLQAGVLYAIFDRTNESSALKEALAEYQAARNEWAAFSNGAGTQYAADITFGLEKQLRGNWKDRLAAIDQDIADMQAKFPSAKSGSDNSDKVAKAIALVKMPPARPEFQVRHTPAQKFKPGQELAIEIALPADAGPVSGQLAYRRVDQSEAWEHQPLASDQSKLRAVIPAEYTNSPYPLQYYFELRQGEAGAYCLYPGLGTALTNQPYFVVRREA